MEKRRILILGVTKENTYEVRNLLDNRRLELELALHVDTAKVILSTRKMDVVLVHTEIVSEALAPFFEFLEDEGLDVPLVLVGEEAERLAESVPYPVVARFEKPYAADALVRFLREFGVPAKSLSE